MTPTEIEAAAPGDERRVLKWLANDLWCLNFRPDGTDAVVAWVARWSLFHRRLDAEAYLDAAMMLVQDDLDFEVRRKFARLFNRVGKRRDYEAWAATPALALCAAIARGLGNE